MNYIASFKYVQQIGNIEVDGEFQVVGEIPQHDSFLSGEMRPRVSILTDVVLAKVKEMAESSNIDFEGSTDFYLDSLIEFRAASLREKPFVINLATRCHKDSNLTEIPLDSDTDSAVAHRSTQIGSNKPTYTHVRKASES